MAVNLSPLGGVGAQFFDSNGNPLSGGMIYTYAAGTNTPQATYTNFSGLIQHSNPIVLDAAGRVPTGEIWLTDGVSYKFVIQTSAAVLVGTYDNIVGINSNFIAYTSQQEIQTATAGQTVFDLTTMQYQPGTHNLSVFVDGVNQYGPGAQYAYVETDSDTVTFVNGLHVGASVKFTTATPVASGATDAFNVSYTPPFTGSAGTNVGDKLAQYVSVKDFGAVGDGVTDDTAALQAAFAYCCDTHNTLYFPPGTYTTTTQLNVTSGFQIVGSNQGSNQSIATQPNYACRISWIGSDTSTEYIIAVKSATVGQYVMGFGITGLALTGNTTAYGCLHLTNIRYCQFGTFWVDRARAFGVLIDDNNGSIICGQSQFDYIYSVQGPTSMLGVVLRSNGGSGLTQININRVSGYLEVGDADSCLFGHVQGTLVFRGTGSEGNPRASRKCRVLWFAGGLVTAEAGSKNIIDWVNSEGTAVVINDEASLAYSVLDRKNGMRYDTLNYLINDKKDLELNLGTALDGSPVIGSAIGSNGLRGLLLDDSSIETWQWTFREPKQWRELKLQKIELLCWAANSGDVSIRYGSGYRPIGTGIAGSITTTDYVNSITGGVTNLITLDVTGEISGIDLETGDAPNLLTYRVGRNGTDAADTLVGDFVIFGVRLHVWGNAGAEGTVYRYDPSPDVASIT